MRPYAALSLLCVICGCLLVGLLGAPILEAPVAVPEMVYEDVSPNGDAWIPEGYYTLDRKGGRLIEASLETGSAIFGVGWGEMYEIHVFDCSNMAAMVEWVAEDIGLEARICVSGGWGFGPDGEEWGHAWVQVKNGNTWEAFDAATLAYKPRSEDTRKYYGDDKVCYDDIYEIADTLAWGEDGEQIFITEWRWW